MHSITLAALADLRRYYHQHGKVTTPQAEYFRSQAYQDRLQAINDNPAELARLAIALLSHMALDPRQHHSVTDSLVDYPGTPTLLVHLQFYRVSSPLPVFTLPTTSTEAKNLRDAVAANLASSKYKAACAHVRQSDKQSARFERFDRLARPARAAVWDGATPALQAARRSEFEYSRLYQETGARAVSAYNDIHGPLRITMENRMSALLSACYDTDYQGSYYGALIAFATAYLYEEQEPVRG